MAQGARLILRMQKELKLLLTDPPPGASFPTLSDDSSLTSIDALLQGPEGTVYANGVFKIKIQIPERYPFQPPTVTFATPIYHPNIDNGGRICLDILNLPPKGMWQPSLNISTVLTSIGLLLSEPNPDDGLMHEASRDYKYNRQAFDHNARSMTEKYARAGETKGAGGSHGTQAHAGQSTSQSEIEGSRASKSITEHRKLSLQSLGSRGNEANGDKDINNVSSHDYAKKHNECEPLKESNHNSSRHTGNPCILKATGKKLSLKVPVSSHHRNGESEKENLGPVSNITSVVSENVMCCNDTGKQAVGAAGKSKMSLKLKDYAISDEVCFRESNAGFKQVDEVESSHTAEAVIVLDSEDESEDEIAPVRSKLSLARRCFSRKRKVASDR